MKQDTFVSGTSVLSEHLYLTNGIGNVSSLFEIIYLGYIPYRYMTHKIHSRYMSGARLLGRLLSCLWCLRCLGRCPRVECCFLTKVVLFFNIAPFVPCLPSASWFPWVALLLRRRRLAVLSASLWMHLRYMYLIMLHVSLMYLACILMYPDMYPA